MTVKTGLAAIRRHETGKGVARRLRAAGQVPAVLYGKDQESISLTLDAQEALSLFHSISVENTIVNVRIDDDKEELETLVREIQMHAYRPDIVHVDFYCIERGVALEVEIPANYNGTPQGVREGGVLEVILHEFRVKCLPSQIPESIEVDISHLDIGDSIHASEISMDAGVELLTDPGQTVCLVSAPRA
ncbi:MAG TPA: 50S ribosomal protein L25, partial [Gemmatimonadetes bacterium]|nr:50S ribosomal protein L25 [Gemmatimonadota bacterium]